MAELERTDALRIGLAALGEAEPLRSDDLLRAEGTVRAFQGARRRRTRLRAALMGSMTAMAAVLVLGWWSLSRVHVLSIEVSEGVLELQQDRLALGDAVPTGEWIEISQGRACMRIAARDVCGEAGTRMRFDASGGIELAHGRVRADDGITLTTVLGTIAADGGALDLEIDELGTVTVHAGSATLHGAATDTALGLGTHVLAPRQVAVAPSVPRPAVPPSSPDLDEPVITAGDDAVSVAPSARRSIAREPVREPERAPEPSAGEMLAAARALASANKLEPAARAYQKLIDAHPSSSEARAGLVSLGRVQASRGKSSAALAAFSAYLQRGSGALAEEAHWGRISALHALGRAADRDRAIEALAAAHPRSVYLLKARKLGS